MRILAWLVALSVVASTLVGLARQASSPANTAKGAALVAGKGECLTCHRVQGKGSRLGPDLTDIGSTRTPVQLQTSLLDPNAEVLPENRFYRVVTRDGTSITGRLLNHDTFQVLMMDPKERLRTFQKSELREHGFVKGSMMPAQDQRLSPEEIADIVAYLTSLKGVAAE
ncbi:MAG TPA: c-type cytochrome [Vicinamibacterales bacterium]|jgi:putative heme-binding domain-containing protein